MSVDKRNARDLARIERLQAAVGDCLCAVAFIEPLEHPDARFDPNDLRWPLRAVMQSLAAELERITEAALDVPDDPDITAAIREFSNG
jgi:hypothetical protein